MSDEVKHSQYGPGGRNCHCCGPSPSNRKKHDRTVKRRLKQKRAKDLNEILIEQGEPK